VTGRRDEAGAPPGAPDSLGLWPAVRSTWRYLADAPSRLAGLEDPTPPGEVRELVVLGAGTAGTAGDLVAAYGAPRLDVPVAVVRSGDLPAHVGPGSFVLALCGAPGTDDETLRVLEAAYGSGAHVVVLADGAPGAVRLAEAHGGAVVELTGGPEGRTRLAALSAPALLLLGRAGLLEDPGPVLSGAAAHLESRLGPLTGAAGAPAAVARRIDRTFPVVYGAHGVAAVAAGHWKREVNLNAKTPATAGSLPEVCVDEVAGWGQSGDVTRQVMTLVLLRHTGEDANTAARVERVVSLLDEVVADVVEVRSTADEDLARFFELATFGELVSLHLAAHDGIDPGPVPAVLEALGVAG